jgi:hypothetical protein
MPNLGTLFVGVRAGTKDLKKDLDLAKGRVGNAATKMREAINAINFKHVGIGAGVAAGAAVFAMTKIAKESVALANVQEASEKKLAAVITATGNAAGFNLEQMKAMASGMQSVTTVGDEVILNGMAVLATFKQIKGDGFEQATKAALDMSQVMGTDLQSSIVMIGKALNDPIKNLSAMTRAGVQFTDSQKETIKTLWEAGDAAGAQAIILKEMESQFGGAAEAARETFAGGVEAAGNALGDMQEELGFVITKNKLFTGLAKTAEKVFISWGNKIKENRQFLADLVKSGLVKVAQGVQGVVKVLRFFENAWLGIKLVGQAAIVLLVTGIDQLFKGFRRLFKPLDLLFKALVKMGKIENKNNPFDKMQDSLNDMQEATFDVTQEILEDIDATNRKYDEWDKTVQAVTEDIQKMPTSVDLVAESVDTATTAVETMGTAINKIETDADWNGIATGWDGAVIDMNADTETFKTVWDTTVKDMATGTEEGSISWLEGEWTKSTDRVKGSFKGAISDALIAGATGDSAALLTAWQGLWNSMARILTDIVAEAIIQGVITSGPAKALGSAISGTIAGTAAGTTADITADTTVGTTAGITGSLATTAAIALPTAAITKAVVDKDTDVGAAFLVNPILGATLATAKLFGQEESFEDFLGDIGWGGTKDRPWGKVGRYVDFRGDDRKIKWDPETGFDASNPTLWYVDRENHLDPIMDSVHEVLKTSYDQLPDFFKPELKASLNRGIPWDFFSNSHDLGVVVNAFAEWFPKRVGSWYDWIISNNVDRFHTGGPIGHDERHIIGQVGEGIVSRKGMDNLEKINGDGLVGGTTININGVVTTDDIGAWLADLMQNMQDNDVGFNINTTDTMQAGL